MLSSTTGTIRISPIRLPSSSLKRCRNRVDVLMMPLRLAAHSRKPPPVPGLVGLLQSLGDGIQEISPGKRLEQVAPGPPQPLCLLTQGRFIARRDEDDRHFFAGKGQALVEFKTGHAGKMNVENQAVSGPGR